jgi:hypothetical protein
MEIHQGRTPREQSSENSRSSSHSFRASPARTSKLASNGVSPLRVIEESSQLQTGQDLNGKHERGPSNSSNRANGLPLVPHDSSNLLLSTQEQRMRVQGNHTAELGQSHLDSDGHNLGATSRSQAGDHIMTRTVSREISNVFSLEAVTHQRDKFKDTADRK